MEALRVMRDHGIKDTTLWNTRIGAGRTALELFEEMKERNVERDARTYSSVMTALGKKSPHRVLKFATQHSKEIENNLFCWSAVVLAMGKLSMDTSIHSVFDFLSNKKITPDEGLYSSAITAFSKSSHVTAALKVLTNMEQADINPTPKEYVSILSACVKTQNFSLGRSVYNKIVSSKQVTPEVKSSAARLFCSNGDEAVRFLAGFQEPVPNKTYEGLLLVCMNDGNNLQAALAILQRTPPCRATAPAFMLGMNIASHSSYSAARSVFDMLGEAKDDKAWSCLIALHCRERQGNTVELLKEMEKSGVRCTPNDFIVAISHCEDMDDFIGAEELQELAEERGVRVGSTLF
eukprot:TRINITY_DN19888_c0_g1_i1.p1 TRINITY_DN19888_c0_g1~~TRINITY_DN19888_c0_g1_i1.p1  ORF type:complete len:393 (+),score=55.85 TRINITY_DN19888_c0_g1_i1:134-1180(+)